MNNKNENDNQKQITSRFNLSKLLYINLFILIPAILYYFFSDTMFNNNNLKIPEIEVIIAGEEEEKLHWDNNTFEYISLSEKNPLIRLYPNFLRDQEAEHLIKLAQNRVKKLKVVKKNNYGRTSSTGFYSQSEDDIITSIESRIIKVMELKVSEDNNFGSYGNAYIEPISLIKYTFGEGFIKHVDWSNDETIKEYKIAHQRNLTIIIYLNTLEIETQGGGTSFPYLNITVKPVKNTAVLFSNLNEDGTGDTFSTHQGDQLLSDELKWIVSTHSLVAVENLPYRRKLS